MTYKIAIDKIAEVLKNGLKSKHEKMLENNEDEHTYELSAVITCRRDTFDIYTIQAKDITRKHAPQS